MKPRDIVIVALLVLNLTYLVVRDDVALAAQSRRHDKKPVAFKSASERSLPFLKDIRDSLRSIDGKMDTLIALQQNAAKQKK